MIKYGLFTSCVLVDRKYHIMTRLKLAIIHNTITPYRHPLFEMLARSLDLVVYYSSVKRNSRKWELWPRNYSYQYKVLSGTQLGGSTSCGSLNLAIIKELISQKPDVVVLSDYTSPTVLLSLIITKLMRLPFVYWTEGVKEPHSLLGKLTRPLRIFFSRNSKSIIVPGQFSKEYVLSLGAKTEKVFIAPNSIDNKLFANYSIEASKKSKKIREYYGFKNEFIVLCIGQLIERKGIGYLLRAYSKLEKDFDNIALLIVGNGPLKPELENLAKSLRIKRFKIIPSGLNLETLVNLYSISDVFVLPTLEDIWGIVINEAMACCLPVISTSASQAALEMIIPGENGIIINEGNDLLLYSSIRKIILMHKTIKLMGKRSSEIVNNDFSPEKMSLFFVEAIKNVFKSEDVVKVVN